MAITVLVVEDSDATRAEMRSILENSGLPVNVLEAADGSEALGMVFTGEIDVVVSDILMPKLDGVQLLRTIRKQRDAHALPVILVTSDTDQEKRNLSFEAGVNDYLCKPFGPVELLARVKVQLRLKRLQDELRFVTERHRRLGTHDDLTGLANRRHLLDLARRELARSRRHKFSMSIVMVDVGGFRALNQRSGYLVGDAVISELGQMMERGLRTQDTFARFAVCKFAALLPQTDGQQARIVAERLCDTVNNHPFPGQKANVLTLAVGISTYPNGPLESIDELVNAAEASLERAREKGGSRIEVWTDIEA